MKIIILGAGAIGSLFGAKLSELNDVTLIGRREHVDRINKHGLMMAGLENKIYRIRAADRINKIKENTLIILSTKVYDSEKSINPIKNLLRKDTIILCLQNGMNSEDIVKKIVGGRCTVLRGITNFGAIYLKPGHVNYTNYSYTAIEKSRKSNEIAGNFKKCGLNGYAARDIKYEMWKKLIFNCVLNPITAILKMKNKGIIDEKINPLKKLIVDECLEVAGKDGIYFDIDFVKAINKEFINSKNISSMQQDLLKGKRTEIDYLNGAVVALGKKYSIECPVNEALTIIIKGMEKTRNI